MEGQSSTAAVKALQTSRLELLNSPTTPFNNPPSESESDCPLTGAYYDSMDQFGRTITVIRLGKEYFEESHGIVEYAELITKENDEVGVVLDERMVSHLYTVQVFKLWEFGSPMAEKLLSQLECPLMKHFWELRTSPETFNIRNTNNKHDQYCWSQSSPIAAPQAADKGMIVMENRHEKFSVPMIGLISQMEELNMVEIGDEIRKANPKIRTRTVAKVLEGILEHVYYDPTLAVREELLKEIEIFKATPPKTRRSRKPKSTATGEEGGDPSSSSKPSQPHTPAGASDRQATDEEL